MANSLNMKNIGKFSFIISTLWKYGLQRTGLALLLCACFFGKLHAQHIAPYKNNHYFDTLKHVAKKDRLFAARKLYKKNLRRADSATAFYHLEQLKLLAAKLGDNTLECRSFEFKADYMASNTGLNPYSLQYYQQAIDLAGKYQLPQEQAYQIFRRGEYYYNFNNIVSAYRDYLKSYDLFKKIGFGHVPEISIYLKKMAKLHYEIDDFESARALLEEALPYEKAAYPRDMIDLVNTIGLAYRGEKNYALALKYFNKAALLAKKHHDTVWVAIANGNTGSVYYQQGNYDKALPLLQQDYTVSLTYNEPHNACMALLRMVNIFLHKNQLATAQQLLQKVEPLLVADTDISRPKTLWHRMEYYRLCAIVAEQQQAYQQQTKYFKQYLFIKDSLNQLTNVAAVERVKLNWEKEKYYTEISDLETKAQNEKLKGYVLIAITGMAAVILLLLYNRQQIKRKRDRLDFEKQEALLQLEKTNAEADLRVARQSLHGYTESLKQKNTLIAYLRTETQELQQTTGEADYALQLEKKLTEHLITEDNREQFRSLFNKVYPHFFSALLAQYPNLSKNDLWLLALIKLGLPNSEVATMLGVTPEGVKKARQRVRKKMNLSEQTDIQHILNSIRS